MGQSARAFFLGVLIVVYLACHSPHAVACMVVCEANANASSSSFFISNSRLRTKRLVNALTPRCCGRPTVVAHKHACGPRAGHPVVNPVHCNTPFNTMESMHPRLDYNIFTGRDITMPLAPISLTLQFSKRGRHLQSVPKTKVSYRPAYTQDNMSSAEYQQTRNHRIGRIVWGEQYGRQKAGFITSICTIGKTTEARTWYCKQIQRWVWTRPYTAFGISFNFQYLLVKVLIKHRFVL